MTRSGDAGHHRAGRRHDELAAQLLCRGVQRGVALGLEDQLDEPGPVAQVDEDQPAVVAAAVDPAGHLDLPADECLVDIAAPFVSVCHR